MAEAYAKTMTEAVVACSAEHSDGLEAFARVFLFPAVMFANLSYSRLL